MKRRAQIKILITAAIIALTATAAHADKASDFAECVVNRMATERGLTLTEVRAADPATVRNAQDAVTSIANKYLEMPSENKTSAQVTMLTQIPQSAACLSILEN